MKNFFLFGFFCFLVYSSASQQRKFNGVSFVASSRQINQTNIDPVLNVNANAVALMPFGFIRDISSPKLTFNSDRQWFGETKKGLIQYALEFQKKNVQIMVNLKSGFGEENLRVISLWHLKKIGEYSKNLILNLL